jgi:LysM repeat protein
MEYSYWTDGITLDKSYSYGHQVADNSSDERPHLNTQTMVYNYAVADMWDMYKERSVVVSANNPDISASRNSNWQDGESYYLYNSNGHHLRVFDAQGHRELGYKLNHLGQVLQRQEYRAVIDGGNGDPQNRNFYYLNGITVGDFGTDKVLSRYDYAASLAEVNSDQHGDFGDRIVPTSSANFDQNYQPINPAYPGGAPTQVVVQAGDTLQVLAARLWGDSSLWYLLADANGLDSNSTLTEGQRLSVPNVVTNIHNNSETFKPYDPGLAIGDTTPTLPDPPPPPKPGCAKLVLVAVVAVAVAWALTPMIVQTMAAWGAGLGAAIGAGATAMSALAITGAVIGAGLVAGISSFASQLAARRLGLVDDIDKGSIRDAFKAGALTKAFTYGIDQALSSSRTLEEARSVVDVGNLNDGVKTLNQMRTSWYESSIFNDIGTGLKTGFANAAASAMVQDGKFRDNFDWHTVAASVVVAPVAGYVRRNIFNSEIGGKSVTQFSAALDESGNYAAMGSAFAFEGSAPNTPGHAFMNSLIAEGLESYASYRFHHRKDKYRPDAAGLFAGALVSAGASFYAQYQQNRREEKQYQAYNNRYVGDVASYLADPNTGFHESVLSGKELKLELAPEDIRRYLEQFQYDMQTRTPLDGVDGPEAEPYEGVQVLSSSPSSESPRDDRRYMYPMIADISDYRADPYAEKLNSTYGFEGFGLLDDTDKWLKLALSADFTRAESYDKYREANDFIVGKIGEYQEHINGMGDRLTQFLYADKLDLYKQNMIDQGYYLNKDINPSLDGVPTAKGADELFGFIESRSLSRAEDIGARVKDVVMAETTDVTEINQKVKEVLREYLFDYIGQEGNGFIDGIGVEQAYDTTFTDNMNLMSKLSDSLSEERKYSGNTDLSKGLGGLASGLTYTKAFIEYFKYDDPYQASETLLGEGLETIGTKYLMPKAVSGFKKLIWGARVTAAGSSSTGVGIGAGLSMFLMAELADQTANVIMKEIKPWMNKEDRSRTYDQLFENKLKPELARRFTQAESGAIINQALSSTSSEVKLGEHSASIYSLRKYSFMNEKYSAFVGQAFDANRRSAFYYYRPGTIAQ